jgi:hypothetical protein
MLVQPTPASSPSEEEDEEVTVMTDDSDENRMSLQSFQLESSLGEDFLSLFAPAGR